LEKKWLEQVLPESWGLRVWGSGRVGGRWHNKCIHNTHVSKYKMIKGERKKIKSPPKRINIIFKPVEITMRRGLM
jgi:hypothetical protein